MRSTPFAALFVLGLAGASMGARAEEPSPLDPASLEALAKTQALLVDPAKRASDGKNAPESESVQRQVRAMAGSDQDAEAIYGLASEIFADMAKKSGGDPLKMMEMIEAAKADPAGFGAGWSPAQREKVREISKRMPASAARVMPAKP